MNNQAAGALVAALPVFLPTEEDRKDHAGKLQEMAVSDILYQMVLEVEVAVGHGDN